MTPGWRRWAAILTTYTCLVAGAVPSYRIRVPPPGQLVALSGDDLRVELDLPPPGIPLEAPNTPQRRLGEAERDTGGATGGSGRVRRDGELWIELVDMEIEDERIRRKKEEEEKRKKEEDAERGRRWRREDEGEIGRREIVGEWNRVDIKGKIKEKQEKKSGSKRYGWVAGGVRPKGEKESVVKIEGKGDEGGKWREDNRSGKWEATEEIGGSRRQKTEGKIWWKSWSGRAKGVIREGERRKEEGVSVGDGKRGEERGKEEEGSGEAREEGENTEEEGKKTEKESEKRRGLILESTLVSRGWHDLQSEVPPNHRGPLSPHSTLSLSFPASHFTHGGLYVVRLVGTGRMVASPGTQRPQRATPPGREPQETQTRSSEFITRRAVTEEKKNSSLEMDQEGNQENQASKPTESEENTSEVNTQASETTSHSEDLKPVTQNPPSSFVNVQDAKDTPSKSESDSHMFSKIVETLESRFRWNEKYTDSRFGSSPGKPEGQKLSSESLSSPTAKRRKREPLGEREVNSIEESEPLQLSLDNFISRAVDVRRQRAGDGPRHEQESGPQRVADEVARKRTCRDCSGLSDYQKVTGKEQWGGSEGKGALGKGHREGIEGDTAERDDESDRRKRRRREEWRSGGEGRSSTSRGDSESAFKMHMESKAGDSVSEGDTAESGEILSPTVFGRHRIANIETKERSKHLGINFDQKSFDWKPLASANRRTRGLPNDEKVKKPEEDSVTKASISRIIDGRSSRETVIICNGNCEPTTRHILAEENVLVSWPAARFTLNILSSTPPSPSPFSTPTTTSKDSIPQNITFGTFESPVKVVVEISCGVGKVGGRSKRYVPMNKNPEEYEDSKEALVEGEIEVYSSSDTLIEGKENEKDEGAKMEGRGRNHDVTEDYEESDLASFLKGSGSGGEETMEKMWGESIESSSAKSRNGNRNKVLHWESSSSQPVSIKDDFSKGKSGERPENLDRVRIRKERVTKFDITDDLAESLSLSILQSDEMGFPMKREASKEKRVDRGVSKNKEEGITTNHASRRKRAARDIASEKTRNSITSQDPKIELSPGPASLPFRLFLVLRYCGPDSTECDEEKANLDNIDEWKRPQTVYTEELADFPLCPSYRHQVILPCEAFGQAGVYMVQVRSNYTLDDGSNNGLSELSVGSQEFLEKRRKRNGGSGVFGTKEVKSSDSRNVTSMDGAEVSSSAINNQSAVKKCRTTGECNENVILTHKSEESSASPEITVTESIVVNSKGDSADSHDYRQTLERKRGERDAYPWDSPDSWWEGSGDVEGDDGSGDWGDGWGGEGGRERRGGSGDGEYSDDPEGGETLTSPQKFPEPPPRSLWSSSDEIHVHLSKGYVFTVHARSVFPCSDAHVKPDTLEPAPSGVPVLFEYPQCILDGSDRVRVFGRARPDVSAILPPFWMGSDASVGAAATLSHPSLKYVAEKKIYKGKHTAWFDCSLFTERYSEYCFAYASEAMTGAVTHVRAQCIPTLPTSDEDRGGWGSWSSWSQCSTTCGSGSRNRYRTCDNPPPRYGAPFCEGTALETERCPPPTGITFEELQEMCPLGLALSAGDGVNRRGSEPSCRCGGCIVHLQGVAGSWDSHNAGPIKTRPRVLASSSQACPGRSFWLLEAEPGNVVGLTVSSILLPCPRRQWLKARDGDSLSSRLILHLPSSSNPASVPSNTETLCFSSGPHLLLEFYSFERLEPTCNGGFLAHAHQILANSSAAAIGKEVLLAPTTRAVSRSSISVHFAALAFVLALVALSGGLALNYIFRRKRFIEEMKKREKEEEEMSDSDSDTKCFIARNKDGGSVTSVTSVSDVISLRKLSIGRDGKRREVHMRLREETEEDEEADGDDGGDEAQRKKRAAVNTDSNAPAKAICPKVVVIEPGAELARKIGRVRELVGVPVAEEESGEEGDSEEGAAEERKDGEVTRRRRRKGASGATRREWRESACPLLEQETVTQSSISLPSSPTEPLSEEQITSPNAPGRPGLSASAPLLLRRSLSFFAAAASASTAGAVSDSSSEGGVHSLSAAGRQWWRKKLQRFQNGSVSPVREELEETWRLADPQSTKEDSAGKSKKPSGEATPAKECKEKQNRERLLRAGAVAYYPNPPSSTPSNSPSSTTSPEMGVRGVSGSRLRGRLRARVDERGKCNSEASLAGGASELDLEFDYYDYNVQNAGAAPGSYLGMDPAFLVYIPPFEGSTSPSSEASSASTLQAPPSETGNDLCTAFPPLQEGGGGATLRGEYYCINASYARANFQDAGANCAGNGVEDGSAGSAGEMVSLTEFRRDSIEEGKGSEKETRVEKSPAPEEEDEIKFVDEEEEDEVVMVSEKKEENKYGMIKMENLRLKKPI